MGERWQARLVVEGIGDGSRSDRGCFATTYTLRAHVSDCELGSFGELWSHRVSFDDSKPAYGQTH